MEEAKLTIEESKVGLRMVKLWHNLGIKEEDYKDVIQASPVLIIPREVGGAQAYLELMVWGQAERSPLSGSKGQHKSY